MDDQSMKDQLLDAALMHVPFDGWSATAFDAAVADTGIDPALARAVCPRGAVDLALAYHQRGDEEMVRRIHAEDLSALRFRDRVAAAPPCSRCRITPPMGHARSGARPTRSGPPSATVRTM